MKTSAVFRAVLFLTCPLTALAGPPFVTDDPEPVDYQHWEFYIASQPTETSDGGAGTAPHFELNYGIVTNVQLHIIMPLVDADKIPAQTPAHAGWNNIFITARLPMIENV